MIDFLYSCRLWNKVQSCLENICLQRNGVSAARWQVPVNQKVWMTWSKFSCNFVYSSFSKRFLLLHLIYISHWVIWMILKCIFNVYISLGWLMILKCIFFKMFWWFVSTQLTFYQVIFCLICQVDDWTWCSFSLKCWFICSKFKLWLRLK